MGTRVLDMVIEGNLGLRPYMFLLIIKVPDQHVQHVLRYFFVIVHSTLLGLYETLHIFQEETSGLPPNPTGLF